MKLYYMAGACSLADHIALQWSGQPYETQKLSHDQIKQDWYLKLNPSGAVPTFEEDGWVLTQNTAILNYLADCFPNARLGGDGGAKGRAEVNRWLGFINADMHPSFKPLFGTTGYLQSDDAIAETKAHAKKTLRGLFEQVDAHLEGREWLAGKRSVADPYLFVMLRWAEGMGIDLSGLDDLEAYFQRIRSDAAVQHVLQDEGLN